MLPITLDLAHLRVALVGNGAQTSRRLASLDDAGAERLQVFAPEADDALARQVGARLHRRWPRPQEISAARLLFIADGVDPGTERDMIAVARADGTLVNVEDKPALSDFHSPAMLRRGDLTIAISTAGRSPALARRLRHFVGMIIGPEWHHALDEIAQLRSLWREGGAEAAKVTAWTDAWLDRQGHLSGRAVAARSENALDGAVNSPK